MTITDIKPARKSLSRVYIDGEYAMNLDTQVLYECCVKIGTTLDDDELKELIDKSDYKRAKERALWLLSGRDYSKKQLIDKIKKDSPPEVAAEVCERMEELGLVNDESYARRYASDLLNIKKMSKRGAKFKMIERGIDRDLCDEILDEFDVDPVRQIADIIERKYADKLDDEKGRRRTVAALQRLGYGWGDIKSAISMFEEEDF